MNPFISTHVKKESQEQEAPAEKPAQANDQKAAELAAVTIVEPMDTNNEETAVVTNNGDTATKPVVTHPENVVAPVGDIVAVAPTVAPNNGDVVELVSTIDEKDELEFCVDANSGKVVSVIKNGDIAEQTPQGVEVPVVNGKDKVYKYQGSLAIFYWCVKLCISFFYL